MDTYLNPLAAGQLLVGFAPIAVLIWTGIVLGRATKEPWRTHGLYLYLWIAAFPHAIGFALFSLMPYYGLLFMVAVAASYTVFAAAGLVVAGGIRLARPRRGQPL